MRGELKMRSLKRIAVVALIMAALIIPVIAISESASGAAELRDESITVSGGFSDRSNGTVTVNVFAITEGDSVTVTVSDLFSKATYATATRTATEAEEEAGYMKFVLSFRIGTPGTYHAAVVITGDDVNEARSQDNTLVIEVGKSIWSSIWTYVAIIVVIIIIGIVVLIRMRAVPKVDNSGAFTAMEEERQVKRKSSPGAKKEEYKGRSKK